MIVYLDILLFLNLFINYFLLLSVSAWNKIRPPFCRMLLGSMVGASVSLIILFPPLPTALDIVIKLTCCFLTVLATFSFRSTARFIRIGLSFFAVSFAFAGIMLAIWFTIKPSGLVINNSAVYFNISPILLIISTLISYIIIRIVLFFREKRNPKSIEYSLAIVANKQRVECNAILDTGHNLTDLFTGDPVIVTEYAFAEPLISIAKRPMFSGNIINNIAGADETIRLIPYTAVGGEGFLPSFRPDYIELTQGERKFKTNHVLIAVSKTSMSPEYKALISSDLTDEL